MRLKVVILTATGNALFNSNVPKHLHPLAGYPILNYTLDLARQLTTEPPVMVVDPTLTDAYMNIAGDNVHCVQPPVNKNDWDAVAEIRTLLGTPKMGILILHADAPLMQLKSLQRLIERHAKVAQGITFLTNELGIPDDKRQVMGEESNNKQSTHPDFVPCIINSELLNSDFMQSITSTESPALDLQNLTTIAHRYGISVTTQMPVDTSDLWMIRTRIDHALAHSIIQSRINNQLMLSGVTIIDPSASYIDHNVVIGRDTVIYPNTTITGMTSIGENCHIGPNTTIDHCKIGDRCRVFASVLESAEMEHDSDIGPFSHLRKGAYVCAHAHIGNYGEMKNSTLGPGAKMGHFSYIGDTRVGEDTNIGAGTITCNFDGAEKHATHIGDNVFIGSGTLIVAPIDIGDNAATGAGSVVTHNIPANTLVYGVPAREKKNTDSK